ncbi:heavy-metal-associated domain-containing protein [Pedobacter aquae]|uniref:Heavy-metal-associated domain-containing protein n=1 Tax=Pedobacter aquae TaxID=2605747 RepID=A0A5C0VFY3_9SPHI|nr:heavy-metal-associated domain-containing protein [Pedobacter aquae]QEK50947.1 heavy-metal-associated domain-containing protein [Pedobacter aquae]
METIKFKTNIKCGGCIATVTPALNSLKGLNKWEVDTVNADKILTVEAEGISAQEIADTVKKAGFTAEQV